MHKTTSKTKEEIVNFCQASVWLARHNCHNDSLMYVHVSAWSLLASAHPSVFVRTITSTTVDEFQNNLTQLFSIKCRCAIRNIGSGKPKVKFLSGT